MIDGGLVDVRTVHRTVEAAFRDAEHLLQFSWSHGQRAMWEAVPEQERPALRRQIIATMQEFGDGAGRLSFSQQARYTLGRRATN